jgi:3-oxoacyl-(acyl-carrier-protein) synthase
MAADRDLPACHITGVGLLTPLGHSAWSTWRALLAGRCLTDRCANAPEGISPVDLVRAVGCVSVTPHSGSDPAIDLAERAARQAVEEGGRESSGLQTVIASSKGAVGDIASTPTGPLTAVGDALRTRMGIGPTRHIVAACASSLIGVHVARQWMADDSLDRVLVVSSEAALLPLFIHSYKRLGVLPTLTPADYRARPLDQTRDGFVLTEVGAAILLERSADRPLARVIDTAVACEANDLIRTANSRDALQHIADRLIREPIDLLHPHATGTVDNDESESAVYTEVGQPIADVYACKGALGHGLGSSGLTALILAALAGRTGRRPPMPWLEHPIDVPLPLRAAASNGPVDRQAVFAAGFGGHVAGVLLGKP